MAAGLRNMLFSTTANSRLLSILCQKSILIGHSLTSSLKKHVNGQVSLQERISATFAFAVRARRCLIPPFPGKFQVKDIYTDRFLCTLHCYSSHGPKLFLYDHKELERVGDNDAHYLVEDAVVVNDQGIVDPGNTTPFSGATLHPNALLWMQIWRSYSEWAEECREKGEDVTEPLCFVVPKGECV